jgi:hypothetical protein
MSNTQDLGRAYRWFEEVNDCNKRVHGVLLPTAVYNQACCLSLGVDAVLRGQITIIPELPPLASDMSVKDLSEIRLDLAMETLRIAVSAGYSDILHMRTDPDLQALRELRPSQFSRILTALLAVGK